MKEKDRVISYIAEQIDKKEIQISEHKEARDMLILRADRYNDAIKLLLCEIEQLKKIKVSDDNSTSDT